MYKVLLVEDEEMIMKSMQFLINWVELDCTLCGIAYNGRDGIKQIQEQKPDIVITDIRMPFVDGIEMLDKTKEKYDYQAVIISGYEEFSYAQQALKLGVSDYILKPMETDKMVDTIRRLTQKCKEKNEIKKMKNIATQGGKTVYPFDLTEIPTAKSKHADFMVEYIKKSYANKISLKDLSEQMGVSVPYLNSKFKEGTGYTFNEFLNYYRILQALKLMKDTNMRIYEIADAVGISDYKYFNHVFKKYTGISPTAFLNS